MSLVTSADLSGRRVAVLLDEAVSAGLNTVDWDGRDDLGRALPSGLYLTNLLMGEEKAQHKMLLLR